MAGFTLYYYGIMFLWIEHWCRKIFKKIIPTAIYVFFLIWQIIIGLSVYYATANLTLIQGKYLRKKKKYVSFNVTTKIIKYQLFSLNIIKSAQFFLS